MPKEIIGDDLFSLVYVDTPLEIFEQRDAKGLYKKARAGEIPNFSGIGAEFEEPRKSEFVLSGFNSDRTLIERLLSISK